MSKNSDELKNIILNKKSNNSGQKKVILVVFLLIILLIGLIIVFSLISKSKNNMIVPPEPTIVSSNNQVNNDSNDSTSAIVEEKQIQSKKEDTVTDIEKDKNEPKIEKRSGVANNKEDKEVAKILSSLSNKPKKVEHSDKKATNPAKRYYIQVGAFSIFKPDQEFLNKIINNGFKFTLKHINNMTKVLIGPYESAKKAKKQLPTIREKVEPSAFLVKI